MLHAPIRAWVQPRNCFNSVRRFFRRSSMCVPQGSVLRPIQFSPYLEFGRSGGFFLTFFSFFSFFTNPFKPFFHWSHVMDYFNSSTGWKQTAFEVRAPRVGNSLWRKPTESVFPSKQEIKVAFFHTFGEFHEYNLFYIFLFPFPFLYLFL